MQITESFWKTVCEGRQSDDAHRAFLRYGLGTFEKEKVSLRKQREKCVLLTGYDHVWLVYGFSTRLSGDKTLQGVLIAPGVSQKNMLISWLTDRDLPIEKVFGKKITLARTTLSDTDYTSLISFLTEQRIYPFLTVTTPHGLVKVKKTTFPKPKDDLAKRENFLRLETEASLWKDLLHAFPFTEGVSRAYQLTATLSVEEIFYDEHLLETEPERAREESTRRIHARLGIKRDARLESHECTFTI